MGWTTGVWLLAVVGKKYFLFTIAVSRLAMGLA
jgi:hypothetical protein